MHFQLCLLLLKLLDIGVGADDVLDLIRVGVLEGEAAGADQHPLPVLGSEPIHDRQHLAFQLDHLLEALPQMALILGVAEL